MYGTYLFNSLMFDQKEDYPTNENSMTDDCSNSRITKLLTNNIKGYVFIKCTQR